MAKEIVSTSKKEIYSKLLDIAGNYIDVVNTDFVKTGLFGYMTESIAMAIRDTTFHTSMMYNESFLNTAIIPKSVYNWAKMFNIEVQRAYPGYANIELIFPSEAFENFSGKFIDSLSLSERNKYNDSSLDKKEGIIIDRDDPIIAGDYYFTLERSIVVYKGEKDIIKAEYLITEDVRTSFDDINAYNRNLIVKNDGTNIIISARAYQYKRNVYDRQIISTSFLNKIQRYTFEGQFCGANLYYRENGNLGKVNLQYSDLSSQLQSQTAYYNLVSDNEIEIIFKSGERMFMPSANSNIILEVYTTEGQNIPASYSDTAFINFSKTDMKTFPLIVSFNPVSIIGGKNAPSLTDIKETIIREISTRNTITTQSDLDNYFAIIMSLVKDINNGRIKFVKQRDDILRRMYSAYLLIRDNVEDISGNYTTAQSSFISSCVPTNTIDVRLSNLVINNSEKSYQLNYPIFNIDGTLRPLESKSTEEYYVAPFRILVNTQDVELVKYVYDVVDQTIKLNYETAGDGDWFKENYMSPVSVRLYKELSESEGFTVDNQYKFKLTVVSNLNLKDNIKFDSVKINSKNTGDSFDLNISSDNISCIESTPIDENNTAFNNVILITTPESTFSGEYLDKISFGENSSISSDNILSFNLKFNDNNVGFVSNEKLSFFKDLSGIMESYITNYRETIGDENITFSLGLTDVPVIHSSFFKSSVSSAKKNGFTSQLFAYIELLKENLGKLETSTFFNLKFYNTYGYSHLYDTSKTNLELGLRIVLKDLYKDDEELKKQIISYIRRIVDKMNDSAGAIRVSDIIATVSQPSSYGYYIDHISFEGLNNTFNQFITKTENDVSDGYTPEWLNLDSETISEKITFE